MQCARGVELMGQRQRISSNKPWIKKIDFIFYNEQEIRLAVLEARSSGKPLCEVPGRNGSGVSDPTARDAMYNLTPLPVIKINGQDLRLPERWLIVIDKTYAWAKSQSDVHYEVAKRRYRGEDYRVTCRELHIANTTRRNMFETIRIYAALQAAQMNVIYIE